MTTTPSVEDRLAAVEAALVSMSTTEIRTPRLVVTDDHDRPRVVIETTNNTAEVRVVQPGTPPGRSCDVTLFAQAPDDMQNGSAMGLSFSTDGDQFAVVEAVTTDDGWQLVNDLPIVQP